MEKVKKTAEYTVYKKKSGRYAVKGKGKSKPWLHGDDKAQILLTEGLIEPPKQKAPPAEPEPASEGEGGESAQEAPAA